MPKKTIKKITKTSKTATATRQPRKAAPATRKAAPAGKKAKSTRGGTQPARAARALDGNRIRWAVVGQGYFAQSVVLPAFANARNGELVALFSDDEVKRNELRRRHKASFALPYDEYDDFLRSGEVDAVYLAVPNHLHRDFTVRAADAGVHVLCEKPMAPNVGECEEMIEACARNRVKLMIAYRLHLEKANLSVVEEIAAGVIGEPRYLQSAFSFQLEEGNVRSAPTAEGGGPLFDIGTYCINAARYLFRAEPTEVVAFSARRPDDPRFDATDETVSAILRFPEDRLATFTVSFGAQDMSSYTVVGTEGSIRLDPAYAHGGEIQMVRKTKRGQREKTFKPRDQVGAELLYFADCVLENRDPQPSGTEGLHDVRIIEAILESARTGHSVKLSLSGPRQRPSARQAKEAPPVDEPELVRAESPRSSS